jgi:ribosomal-protein-alanine N-acetyltransferase
MIQRDLPEVVAISRSTREPWDAEGFRAHLKERSTIAMVAELGERVVGYVVYELLPNSLRLITVAVDPHMLRRGIGSVMLRRLISKLDGHRRALITTDVRETDVHAQHFLRSLGFLATNVWRDFYEDTREDAYSMEYVLED